MELFENHNLLEDDDDLDDINIVIYGIPRRVYIRRDYFNNLDHLTFFRRFRVTKQTALFILDLIEEEIEHPYDFNNNIAPINQRLIFLRLCATGTHLACIGDFIGADVSSISRIIKRVARALAAKSRRFIKMPETVDEMNRSQLEFYEKARFPHVIGAVDGTHIRIQSPGDSGYYLRAYLLTPLLNPITPREQWYNESHIRTRNVVERSIGVWKRRFPILAYGCRLKLETIMDVVVATAVVYNICKQNNEADPPDPDDLELFLQLMLEDEVPNILPQGPVIHAAALGLLTQRNLIDNYFAELGE